jgi:hypothetical protein
LSNSIYCDGFSLVEATYAISADELAEAAVRS